MAILWNISFQLDFGFVSSKFDKSLFAMFGWQLLSEIVKEFFWLAISWKHNQKIGFQFGLIDCSSVISRWVNSLCRHPPSNDEQSHGGALPHREFDSCLNYQTNKRIRSKSQFQYDFPSGLISSQLVFGSVPRISWDTVSPARVCPLSSA